MALGRIAVTPGFLLLAAWLNYMDRQGLFWLGLTACGLHELGHLTVLWLLGIGVKQISITAVGAELKLERELSYGEELLAALAGPGVNLLLAVFFCRLPEGAVFAGLNLVLALFNLLPVGGLDGGRALASGACLLLGPRLGHLLCRFFSGAVILVVCGLSLWLGRFGGNLTLAIAAAWLLYTGLREALL